MKMSTLLKFMRFWPPYFGAGIRVTRAAADLTWLEVEMKLHWWNKNFVGTQFGGSLYSMTDPFLMLMFIERLGKDYIVWDKAATIRFKKPGKGTVRVRFELSNEQLEKIKDQVDQEGKIEPVFQVQIFDEAGEIIAEVEKVIYVRRKKIS